MGKKSLTCINRDDDDDGDGDSNDDPKSKLVAFATFDEIIDGAAYAAFLLEIWTRHATTQRMFLHISTQLTNEHEANEHTK